MSAAAALKRAVRDAWWTWKGRAITNPPLPVNPRSILFVCLGNICRSPFAEAIAARRAAELSEWPIRFASAGLCAREKAAPADARAAAGVFGVSLDAHRPQPMTMELAASDMIVVMEPHQMEQLHADYPTVRGRVFLLALFDREAAGLERFHIADPYACSPDVYEACYRRIDRAVSALLVAVADARRAARKSAS